MYNMIYITLKFKKYNERQYNKLINKFIKYILQTLGTDSCVNA